MKETIILTDLNERELLRTLARSGKNTFAVRVFNAPQLAKESLIRSGIQLPEAISDIREACIFANIFKGISYFENASFLDAVHFFQSYSNARNLCRNNEEEKLKEVFSGGEFKEKNEAIFEAIQKYREQLKENDLIDSFDFINEAITSANPIDADFVVFKEEELSPLNEELIQHLSNGKYTSISLLEYAGKTPTSLHNISYDDGYGEVNEIEHILSTIIKKNIPFDEVTIALCDPNYIKPLQNYRDNFKIPMTFATGVSFTETNAMKILTLLYSWSEGYYALDPLKNLLEAEEFDTKGFWKNISEDDLSDYQKQKIIKTVGHLRLSEKDETEKLNQYKAVMNSREEKDFPYVERIAQEFNKGFAHIIETYTKTYYQQKEASAVLKVAKALREYEEYIDQANFEDILKLIINQSSGKELSSPGAIHVTDLKGALCVQRKHLFIAGLNAKAFPGSPSEDYLLLDSDLQRFNEPFAKDSLKKINENKKLLNDVIDIASGFGTSIHLSYSGYNLSELKSENPSSMLFETYRREKGEDATMDEFNKTVGRQHSYFESGISKQSKMGESYLQGKDINEIPKEEDEYAECVLKGNLSPSNTDTYFSCPRCFYLENVLGIDKKEEDNVFDRLPANDFGTLVHECMEEFNKNPGMTLETFKENAQKKIDDYFKKRIPVHTKGINQNKSDFTDIAVSAYEMDQEKGRKPVESEFKIKDVEYENTGLKFNGTVDLVEDNGDGTFTIVDYKTGKTVKHEPNDINSCLQAVIYAYLYEKVKGRKIDNNEYRYPRYKQTIECINNEGMKDQLKDRMNQIVTSLNTGVFPTATDKNACKYCKYSLVCGKSEEGSVKNDNESDNN